MVVTQALRTSVGVMVFAFANTTDTSSNASCSELFRRPECSWSETSFNSKVHGCNVPVFIREEYKREHMQIKERHMEVDEKGTRIP
jgi:hypothetical protein